MSDIIDEVLVEQNEVNKVILLRKLLPYIIGISLIMAIGLFAYNIHKNNKLAKNMRIGDEIINVMQSKDNQKYGAILQEIVKQNSKLSEIASLQQVNVLISSGDNIGAKNLLSKIINDNKFDQITISYAKILWLSMVIDQETFSEEEKNLQEKIFSDFKNDNQPFWGVANIFRAIQYINNKENDAAKRKLQSLIDNKNISDSIKELAEIILMNISNKGEI